MSKRVKPKIAVAGLRTIQTLGAVAIPATLEEVPEGFDIKPEAKKPEIFSTDDWKSVQNAVKDIFNEKFTLEVPGEIYRLHQNVKNILRSKTGTFLCDCYKEWLTKEMNLMAAESLREFKGPKVLQNLEEIWNIFYRETLPLLEAILYMVKHKGRPCIRTTTLATFRDVVFLSTNIEDAIIRGKRNLTPGIRHAIQVLQCVNDSYPPSKNKLKIELLAAQINSSYIGYYGLYQNGHLIVTSNEPMIASKRRPSADVGGPRRISRPFSIQPQQMDTLNQIFKNAVRHKTVKGRRPLR